MLSRAELVVTIRELTQCRDYGPTHTYVLSALRKLQKDWVASLPEPKPADPIFRFIEELEPKLGLHAPVPGSPMAKTVSSFPMPLRDAAKAVGKDAGLAFLDVDSEGPCPHGRAHWSECVECIMAQEG